MTVLTALFIVLRIGRLGTIIMNQKWCGCNDKARVKQKKKKKDEVLLDLNGSQFDILYLMENN